MRYPQFFVPSDQESVKRPQIGVAFHPGQNCSPYHTQTIIACLANAFCEREGVQRKWGANAVRPPIQPVAGNHACHCV